MIPTLLRRVDRGTRCRGADQQGGTCRVRQAQDAVAEQGFQVCRDGERLLGRELEVPRCNARAISSANSGLPPEVSWMRRSRGRGRTRSTRCRAAADRIEAHRLDLYPFHPRTSKARNRSNVGRWGYGSRRARRSARRGVAGARTRARRPRGRRASASRRWRAPPVPRPPWLATHRAHRRQRPVDRAGPSSSLSSNAASNERRCGAGSVGRMSSSSSPSRSPSAARPARTGLTGRASGSPDPARSAIAIRSATGWSSRPPPHPRAPAHRGTRAPTGGTHPRPRAPLPGRPDPSRWGAAR